MAQATKNTDDVNSDAAFEKKLAESKANGLRVCIDFTATWCGPCKAIAPVFKSLAEQYRDLQFWRVDYDKCKETAAKYEIVGVPTFLFFVGDTLVRRQSGAVKQKLIDGVKDLSEKSKEELLASAAENTADSSLEIEGDLYRHVDLGRSECLNDDPNNPFANVFQEPGQAKYLKSDTDEQLLLTIGFKCIVSIKNIKFVGPTDDSGPKQIKLFLNKLNMSFEDAEEYKATQEFELTSEDLKNGTKPVQLDAVKFVKTDTLTVFIKSNQGGQEHTVLNQLVLWGRKA